MLNRKPAGVVARLEGAAVLMPGTQHCAAAGAALAQLHHGTETYRPRLSNRRGRAWWRQAARAVRPFLSAEQNVLLDDELRFQSRLEKPKLPTGAIHGDLFRDNVLFVGETVSGIIDFGFAATDAYAYDLAIAVNDWCLAAIRGTKASPTWLRARHDRRLHRAAPLERRGVGDVAGAAARGGSAFLVVAFVRPPPSARRRAYACA